VFGIVGIQLLEPENRQQIVIHRGNMGESPGLNALLPTMQLLLDIISKGNFRSGISPIGKSTVNQIIAPDLIPPIEFASLEKSIPGNPCHQFPHGLHF